MHGLVLMRRRAGRDGIATAWSANSGVQPEEEHQPQLWPMQRLALGLLGGWLVVCIKFAVQHLQDAMQQWLMTAGPCGAADDAAASHHCPVCIASGSLGMT